MKLFERAPNSNKLWNVIFLGKFIAICFINLYITVNIPSDIVCILHYVLSLHACAFVHAYSSNAYACVIVFALNHMSRHAHIRVGTNVRT